MSEQYFTKVSTLTRCPGLFCGRELLPDGYWSECGACPRGFRNNASSACVPCEDDPSPYDWMYLGFMAMFALVLHWFCIDIYTMRRNIPFGIILVHFSALIEIVAASVATLLLMDPVGSLQIKSCQVRRLSDWYTLLHNPTPNYETMLHCTHEAVYPLYTMIFVFYAFATLAMLIIRPLLMFKMLPRRGKLPIYAALYFFPFLALLHATCSGLIYYSFPYITVVLSALSSAAHFAFQLNQTMKSLLLNSVSEKKNIVVIIGHWMLHGYGITAIATQQGFSLHPAMLALIPLPALFYIFTARFTDPHKLHVD